MALHTDRSVAPRRGVAVIVLLSMGVPAILPGSTAAVDTGAVGNGDWSNVATWTSGVPGPMDNAYIGGGYPTGAATAATVTLSQNSSANNVTLGFNSGTAGTLDLNGFTLTATNLFLGGYGNVGSISRTGGGRPVDRLDTVPKWKQLVFVRSRRCCIQPIDGRRVVRYHCRRGQRDQLGAGRRRLYTDDGCRFKAAE